jgi:Fic family protein
MQDILNKLDKNKAIIDSYNPVTVFMLQQLYNFHRIEYTYSSNAIEGNSLTLLETKLVIENGLTIDGKPLRDHLEAIGHSLAYDYMIELANKKDLLLSVADILELHKLFYNSIDSDNAGRFRRENIIITGANFIPPDHGNINNKIEDFINDLNNKQNDLHPVELAAYAHLKLATIHPFIDGNGRISRLVMNLILLNKGYQLISINPNIRLLYIESLNKDQKTKDSPVNLSRFIGECEGNAQINYCKRLNIDI